MIYVVAKNMAELMAFVEDRHLWFVDHRLLPLDRQQPAPPRTATVCLVYDYWKSKHWGEFYEWMRESQAKVLYDHEVPLTDSGMPVFIE